MSLQNLGDMVDEAVTSLAAVGFTHAVAAKPLAAWQIDRQVSYFHARKLAVDAAVDVEQQVFRAAERNQ